jgi:hypothetical protein
VLKALSDVLEQTNSDITMEGGIVLLYNSNIIAALYLLHLVSFITLALFCLGESGGRLGLSSPIRRRQGLDIRLCDWRFSDIHRDLRILAGDQVCLASELSHSFGGFPVRLISMGEAAFGQDIPCNGSTPLVAYSRLSLHSHIPRKAVRQPHHIEPSRRKPCRANSEIW